MYFGKIVGARAFSTCRTMNTIKNITIVGGGAMGSGIAQVIMILLISVSKVEFEMI